MIQSEKEHRSRRILGYLVVGVLLIAAGASGSRIVGGAGDASALWLDRPRTVTSAAEAEAEIATKMERVGRFLDEHDLNGVLLTQVRNFAWMTAGRGNNQIVLNKDVGAGSLLVLRDGSRYVLSSGSESDRLMDDGLRDLGYEARVFDWYAADPVPAQLREITGDDRIGSDIDLAGTVPVGGDFVSLRYELTPQEIERYRWLGRETTAAVQDVLRRVERGMDEFQIEAMTAAALRARGIQPTVLLIAVDDRIYDYRHALAGGATLENYVMVNVVAAKWGMSMAVTRFAHFGPLPEELAEKFEKTAWINAQYEIASRPGTEAADIYERMKGWYAEVGFEGEWQKHHQGGAIGYNDRDWVIHPGIQRRVHTHQAFAWNPTITGAKIEDTIVVDDDGFEVVTRAGDWPMIPIEVDGRSYEQPGVLIR